MLDASHPHMTREGNALTVLPACTWLHPPVAMMILQISAQEAPPLLLREASIAGVPKVDPMAP